jgi:prepilin-type N-terminal cleavage/methylation domain-containing protein
MAVARAATEAVPRSVAVRRGFETGFSLLELLTVLAVVAIAAAVGLPQLFRATEQARLALGAGEIASSLRLTRVYAMRHSANVAVKFSTDADGSVTFALFRDADGDGVRNQDIAQGVDRQVEPWRPLSHLGRGVGFGFPPGPLPPDPTTGRPIGGSRDDPIRFNTSDLASFSAAGTATPGSVYLTDGRQGLIVVRVTNLTGRVRSWRWDRDKAAWRAI